MLLLAFLIVNGYDIGPIAQAQIYMRAGYGYAMLAELTAECLALYAYILIDLVQRCRQK